MLKSQRLLAAGAFLLVAMAGSNAMAQFTSTAAPSAVVAANAVTVSDIRVKGVQRIETATIVSYMALRVGDPITDLALNKSLKALFGTGLFSDVNIQRDGGVLTVEVVENPIINRIAFEGNQHLEDKDLEPEVRLRPRVVYTQSRVQADVQRLIDVYRRSGRFAANVVPKVIRLEQNRVDLVFEISEGETTEINRITFIGNKEYSDGSLREVLQTKETAWYRFLTSNDIYDPDRLTFDRELLRRFYLKKGYADFRVASAVAELTPNREAFFVTFTIEEGRRYRFGGVNITSNLKRLDPKALFKDITFDEDDWYNADEVEATINALTDAVGNLGYAFVDVRPRVKRNSKDQLIAIEFVIQEGPKVFVEKVEIVGNVRTIDQVVRREVRLVEGDAFNAAKVRLTRKSIRNLNFFEKVEVTSQPGSAPDKSIIKVEVQEKSTGELSLGAGFSSTAGVLGDVSIRERNLLGRGQDLKLGTQLGQELSRLDLSFTEPYFLGRKLAAGFDLFKSSQDQQDESSFDREDLGGSLRIGYNLSEPLIQSWSYTLRQDKITSVAATASASIKEQEGTAITSMISHGMIYDKRDNRQNPTEGYFVRINNDFAGAGGSVAFVRNTLQGGYFVPFGGQVVGSVVARAGMIAGLGENTRIVDRFFVGGGNLRGFEDAGVGPRDLLTGDSLGGNWFYTSTAEVTFPLGLPDEFAVLGSLFVDVGTSGDTDASGPGVVDDATLRGSIGFGLTWKSPFGPIRFDLAAPLLKESYDRREVFRFNFGTRF